VSENIIHASITDTPLFHGVPPAHLEIVVDAAQRRHVAPDSFFFQQGDPATALHILDAGQVRMTQLTPDGNQVLLRFIRAGDMFGGVAAFGVKTYPASAQAVEESYALTWDTETMRALMLRFPQLALNALQHTAETIVQLQDRVRELQTERVAQRVARALLRLARQGGKRVEAGLLIDMPLSRQDLAEMTGTNLYSVSRILSAWEKQGLVQTRREHVIVTVPHKLVIIAEDLPSPPDPKTDPL
jgi:CRP/FNR family transcriptional regulator, nitrogen oxide reductase regulator